MVPRIAKFQSAGDEDTRVSVNFVFYARLSRMLIFFSIKSIKATEKKYCIKFGDESEGASQGHVVSTQLSSPVTSLGFRIPVTKLRSLWASLLGGSQLSHQSLGSRELNSRSPFCYLAILLGCGPDLPETGMASLLSI